MFPEDTDGECSFDSSSVVVLRVILTLDLKVSVDLLPFVYPKMFFDAADEQ